MIDIHRRALLLAGLTGLSSASIGLSNAPFAPAWCQVIALGLAGVLTPVIALGSERTLKKNLQP
jgi:uncharacterized membrane protein